MKRLFSLVLVMAVLLSAVSVLTLPAAAAMPSPEVIGGYENVCLTYTYRPQNYDYGQQTVDDLIPYVAYLDGNGNMQDFFFDSYLFLPYVTYGISGASMHGGPKNPTKAMDWIDYVNDTFCDSNNVDALESAMDLAKTALGDSERKAGVFFTILYPAHTATNFGTLGGKSLNLSKEEDRNYAIKWIIDEQIKLYEEKGYENLELLGFYWLEEEFYSDYDEAMIKYASEYLHSLGLKFIWIPWYQAPRYYKWKACGFDLTCMQPNDMWLPTSDENRVNSCASMCSSYGMSMQIEASGHCDEPDYYERYLRYLDGGINFGAMDSVKFYYQEGRNGVYYSACYSDDPTFRSVYDLTYKYAKGTLTHEDLYGKVEESDFEIPEDVEWISYGKSYTGCDSYVDGNGMGYQDVSGDELTDGILGNSTPDTNWHAFHTSLLDESDRMSATIDLGEVYTDLTHVVAQFWDKVDFGVRAPKDVKIYVSEDDYAYRILSDVTLIKQDDMYYINYAGEEPFTARYVKMSFLNSASPFVFCSEFMVGREAEESDVTDSDATDKSVVDQTSHTEEYTSDTSDANDTSNDSTVIFIILGVAVAVISAVLAVIIVKKKKH